MRLGTGMGVGAGSYEPPAPPFTPASLGDDLALWLDAGDGGSAAAWTDKSGNGRDFAQADAAKRPVLNATYLNGFPALVFDGVNDILTGPSFAALAGNGSAEVFVVFKLVADPPTTGSGGCWQLGSPNGTENYVPLTNGQIYAGEFSSTRKTTAVNMGADYFTTPRIFSASSSAGEWKMYLDGVEVYTTATNTFAVGTDFAIGGDPENPGVNLCGGVGTVIIVSPKPSAENRALLIAWLAEEYGLTL